MVLEKIDYYTKVDQIQGLVGQVINLVGEHEIENDSNFDTLITKISERYAVMKEIREGFKPISSQKLKDCFRDAKYRSFYKIVDAATTSPIEEVAEAAIPIFDIIKPYGLGVTQKPYVEESVSFNTITSKLNTPDFKAKMAVIQGCELSFNELSLSQSHFEQADRDWKSDKAEARDQENLTEVRDSLYSIMNDKLISYLEIMMIINPSKYKAFARDVNEFIIANNIVVNGRKNSGDEAEEN